LLARNTPLKVATVSDKQEAKALSGNNGVDTAMQTSNSSYQRRSLDAPPYLSLTQFNKEAE
jgi:hypothetical protein